MTHSLVKTSYTAGTSRAHRPLKLKAVLDGTFCANPSYELLPFNRLPSDQQELFAALKGDPDFYGILRPREGDALPVKSACKDTALLFMSLQQAGSLPSFVCSENSEAINREIVELVLDGVLQILHAGELVHGPAGFDAVCEAYERADVNKDAGNEIAQLSRDALLYAQALPFTEANALSARLYSYGRVPSTPFWKRVFSNEAAVRRCLLLDDGEKNTIQLAGRWEELPADPQNDGWFFWQSRKSSSNRRVAAYKLYVSPHPGSLRDAFEAMVPALESSGANAFKVGKDLSGVLRPDKMVAYFSRFEQLHEAARLIQTRLGGCPAQGVPFTAQIDTPLVSWGADPPFEKDVPAWLARQSWRLWITNRLAVALVSAKRESSRSALEPWRFALERLSLEGVDIETWTPLTKEGK
jgi:hypothetical protein